MRYGYVMLLLVCIQPVWLMGQKYDHQWISGYSDNEDKKFGINLIDFNHGVVEVSFLRESKNYELSYEGSFLNNSNTGKLNIHSNGCVIRNEDWHVISGDGYIAGDVFEEYCDIGYWPTNQAVLLLPDLKDTSMAYLLTKDIIINSGGTDVYTENLSFGRIVGSEEGYHFSGMHKINDELLFVEDLTATPNAMKDAWWLLQAINQTNEIEKYLIGQDTILRHDVQVIGRPFKATEHGIGQNVFSPDGKIFAVNSELGIHLYDFNNETGALSNYRLVEYPDQQNVPQGLGFSPNGRFIYVTTAENVYQIDLHLGDDPYHIGYFRSFDDFGWPVGLGMIFPGPDCRLYVSPGSTTNWLHVILNPDEKGAACNFTERAIEMPARIPHHLPNIPNYRYLTGCDSSIVFPFVTSTMDYESEKDVELRIHPNPSTDHIRVSTDTYEEWNALRYKIYDGKGLLVKEGMLNHSSDVIDIQQLHGGIYYLLLSNGQSDKFIKIK